MSYRREGSKTIRPVLTRIGTGRMVYADDTPTLCTDRERALGPRRPRAALRRAARHERREHARPHGLGIELERVAGRPERVWPALVVVHEPGHRRHVWPRA